MDAYPSTALTDICKQLLDDFELSPAQIANLAKDIAGECEAIVQNRSVWQRSRRKQPDMDTLLDTAANWLVRHPRLTALLIAGAWLAAGHFFPEVPR